MFILDTNSIRILETYYPDQFPSFWAQFNAAVGSGTVVSVAEVRKELERGSPAEHFLDWMKMNKPFFPDPCADTMTNVAAVLTDRHFQQMVRVKQILSGSPVADPFLVAAGMTLGGTVVTEEKLTKNAPKIPNACQKHGVDCTNLRGMLGALNWKF